MKIREERLSQARKNESYEGVIRDVIEDKIPYFEPLNFGKEITLRTTHWTVTKFKAIGLRRPQHFPYIVPELISSDGDYMLITWLTFGSLIRLSNNIQ